jgi:hypothetical protein
MGESYRVKKGKTKVAFGEVNMFNDKVQDALEEKFGAVE